MSNILITGSTGYIGSRLIQALSGSVHQLVCTARNPSFIVHKLPKNARVVQVDFSKSRDLNAVFQGCDIAFFLMHSLGEVADFEEKEAAIAKRFLEASKQAGVKKIIYLGGLMDDSLSELSAHMRSRKLVGAILRESSIPVIEFRASVILGPGSTSFELIRALVERLPIMVTPKWVRIKSQPIFIDDVISYLVQSVDSEFLESKVVEMGGADVVTYQTIMEYYADCRSLRRYMIPVPFLTPYLSSLWLGLVTPVYARVGRKLIDSITVESVVSEKESAAYFDVVPMGCLDAIKHCLIKEDNDIVNTKWSYALSSSIQETDNRTVRYRNRILDVYKIKVPSTVKLPFLPIEQIGGERGWYYLTILWRIRGFIDLLFGGVGIRRGRVHDSLIAEGDTIDWWRVETYRPAEQLRLRAEMKLPGRAWLDFELITDKDSRYIQQTVVFDPLGLFGLIYWYFLLPIHWVMFKGMLRGIIKKAV